MVTKGNSTCEGYSPTGYLLGSGQTNGAGNVTFAGSVALNQDLPNPFDDNYPTGAKIWLVPCERYSTDVPGEQGQYTGTWELGRILFETELITYVYGEEPPQPCFIATAAYGAETAEELDVLRAFRDQVLVESTLGPQFVEWYYQVSPPLADYILENSLLRTVVR